jgi:hypothetical protein
MLDFESTPVIEDVVEAVALSEGLPETRREPALDIVRSELVQRGLHPIEARKVIAVAKGVRYRQKMIDAELKAILTGENNA